KFRNESNLSTWIYKITSNTCLMYLRKASNRKVVVTNEFPEINNVTDLQETEEKFSKMYNCINQLEPSNKLIIMMVLEDLEYDKIATVIGITEENLRVRIHRIKSKLTKCVQNGRV
ncbi:RNA polymerase subunit sigma, partial [Flavobacterium sp. LM5]